MSKRKSYSVYFKLKVLEELDAGMKKTICQKLKIAPSTLSTFIKDEDKLERARDGDHISSKAKILGLPFLMTLTKLCTYG